MDYDKLIAPAAAAMRPSGIRKFFDLAAEMPECISLGVGEPDFKTPWAVREAGIESLEHGRTRYTSNAGLKELRAEIARYLDRRMGLKYDPAKEVLVTVGGSEAIDMCIRTLVQSGDEVIIPEPCFVCYEPITTLSGGVPVHVACRQEDEFRLRADALKAAITPKTKLLIMPFPNNPTGAVMEREDLEAIAEVLRGTLALYEWTDSEMNRRRLEAILDVKHRATERFAQGHLVRGVQIEVTLDSHGFAGRGDICLFGEMLSRFFALYTDIYLFNRLIIILQPTGERLEWEEKHSRRIPG